MYLGMMKRQFVAFAAFGVGFYKRNSVPLSCDML